MVKAFHSAGIEVILDVVYNHTGEGDEAGPTICFRGIDNANYYRLRSDGSGRCVDFTGTGNSLNMMHPRVLQMVMDSLRYWMVEMHVDGFRFDLATTLARGARGEFAASPFFAVIAQDPTIEAAKLIAEPWDSARAAIASGTFRSTGGRERQVSRQRARFLARRQRFDGRVRIAHHRQFGSLPRGRARAAGQHQLCDRARRLHARRPRLVQREAQRGEWRGQSRRRQPESIVELRRRRTDRRSCDSRDSASTKRNFLATLILSQGDADDARTATKSAARSAATTTRTARTIKFRGSIGRRPTRR